MPDSANEPRKRISVSSAWREARDLIAANKGRLVAGFFLMVIGRAAGLVLPASSKVLIDDIIPNQHADWLMGLVVAILGAAIIQAGTAFSLAHILGVAAQRAINDMRKVVQAHVLRLPVRYFDSTQTGKLISRIMHDAEGIRNLVGNGLVELIGGLLTATVALGVLFWLNWQLTTLILIVLAVFGAAMAFTFVKLRPLFNERGEIESEVTGRLGQTLGGIRVVKAYVAEDREERTFADGVNKLFANIRRSINGVHGISAFATVILGITGALLAGVGGQAVIDKTMTLGDFFMYVFFTGMVAMPVIQIAAIGTQISEAFAGLDRIREIRRMAREDDGDATREPVGNLVGRVEFDRVTFSYVPQRPVLKDITFTAEAGKTVALVGPSGSGKSTLVSLVMAFNRPDTGTIRIDGRDLSALRVLEWRAHIGLVLQDNFLFDGTVAANIAFSKPDASRADIQRVADLARVTDFVKEFEKGFDTLVGERGVKLSGGQRQRVAIARALLADPRFLILDEATSSLDSESESQIQQGLETLRKGRTTFVIAHRLSTIRSADMILVLDNGVIVERGTYDELLALNGRFRHLHDTQYRFERERFVNPGEEFLDSIDVARTVRAT